MKHERQHDALGGADPVRRSLLVGIAVSYASFFVDTPVWAQQATNSDLDAFAGLSRLVTGRSSLNTKQTALLFTALSEEDAQFSQFTRSLQQFVESRGITADELQQTLDTERKDLATLPRIIATAWFMGVVGRGSRARCVAYEKALNNVIVADVLRPPTYCTGGYASWSAKPEPKIQQ